MTIASPATLPSPSHPDVINADISGEMSLNEIAAREPQALAVFASYGLDSCCGGAKRLALVCEKHQLDLDAVLRELRALA